MSNYPDSLLPDEVTEEEGLHEAQETLRRKREEQEMHESIDESEGRKPKTLADREEEEKGFTEDPFFPEGYAVPEEEGNYMKFQDGDNRFRILARPIFGNEGWKEDADGKRRPVRKQMNVKFAPSEVDEPDKIKHFWAMPVWNYQAERVQILEITQKGIQRTIEGLARDEDWGSPLNYDLVVKKTGQKLQTEYQTSPKPAKPLDEGIKRYYADMQIDLTALFRNEEPFGNR